MFSVRAMTEADITAVSAIRVAGWKAAYVGIVPQSYLDDMTVEADAEQRRLRFVQPRERMINLVAVDEHSAVVGWACLGPYRGTEAGPAAGELYALYVQPTLRGAGIGRTLLDAVDAHAADLDFDTLLLWVLTDNLPARRFYEQAGCVADGAGQADDYDGVAVHEVRYRRMVPGNADHSAPGGAAPDTGSWAPLNLQGVLRSERAGAAADGQ
ncbi:GNAT family N-acetyltransferase [Streptomyces sp. NPDC048483]|uniref:GNAT family N-acetyltransferase n=1 Tax=Streptomyces sp. NPDC048483 TaxID=3154927 RepID=UPI0034386489